MNTQLKRDCAVILSANCQLEKAYFRQNDACLALHISRNYHLLKQRDADMDQKRKWQDKEEIWWQIYWKQRPAKSATLFFDKRTYGGMPLTT